MDSASTPDQVACEPAPARIGDDEVPFDEEAASLAAGAFLRALGISAEEDGTRQTPRRMARAYGELLSPRPFSLTTFPSDEDYDELVLVRDIPARSVCEHHLLPFAGVAHVGYRPGERIAGLSKLARAVEYFAARRQVQERLARQVADLLQAELQPRGVRVIVEARHSCMVLRGVRAMSSAAVTSALLGTLRADARSRQEFFTLANGTGSAGVTQ
jgi:GTP cyclohydrolase IA